MPRLPNALSEADIGMKIAWPVILQSAPRCLTAKLIPQYFGNGDVSIAAVAACKASRILASPSESTLRVYHSADRLRVGQRGHKVQQGQVCSKVKPSGRCVLHVAH